MSYQTKKRPFIAFDIDGTIYRDSLFIDICHEFCRRQVFPKDKAHQLEDLRQNWLQRQQDYRQYLNNCITLFYNNISGFKFSEYKQIVQAVVQNKINQTYIYPLQLIQKLKNEHYVILGISRSEDYAVGLFCRHHGFDYWAGKSLTVTNGLIDGLSSINPPLDKKSTLQGFVEKYNLDWRQSIAVGDTETDLEMFDLVEKAICFNPSSGLKRVALNRGYQIVLERKDTFYVLTPNQSQQHFLDRSSI